MNRSPLKPMLLLLSFFVFRLADAQVIPDTVLIRQMKENHIPALGLAYIENGQVVFSKVYGELKMGVPAPAGTLFNVASVTKTITTMVTLRLVNSGKWGLDEPVFHYWTDPDVREDPRSKKLISCCAFFHSPARVVNWRCKRTSATSIEPCSASCRKSASTSPWK